MTFYIEKLIKLHANYSEELLKKNAIHFYIYFCILLVTLYEYCISHEIIL